MTDRSEPQDVLAELDEIDASLERQVGLTALNFGRDAWRDRDPLLSRAVDASARLRAALVLGLPRSASSGRIRAALASPAPDPGAGLREALLTALKNNSYRGQWSTDSPCMLPMRWDADDAVDRILADIAPALRATPVADTAGIDAAWIDDLPGITQINDIRFGDPMVSMSAIRVGFAAALRTPQPEGDRP